MPRTVHVDLQERGYEIHVGAQIGNGLSTQFASGTRMLIVTDSNVNPLYGEACQDALGKQGWLPTRTEIPPGEDSKNLDSVRLLYARALEAGLDRSSVLVALGGGVVGDLAGFVAASYMRGIGFVQIPTTLLAMVDSSVGGKTGVNLPEGKNLVGAFYQPSEVLVDLRALRTLPEAEYVAGLAEVVKYGMIWDAVLFGKLEENAVLLLARNRRRATANGCTGKPSRWACCMPQMYPQPARHSRLRSGIDSRPCWAAWACPYTRHRRVHPFHGVPSGKR